MAPAPATMPTKPRTAANPVPEGTIAPAIPALGEVAPALALALALWLSAAADCIEVVG